MRDAVKGGNLKASLQALSQETRARELAGLSSGGTKAKVTLHLRGSRQGKSTEGTDEKAVMRRAMRRLWNSKMPVMHCNNCAFSQQCPQFKAGYECSFNRFFTAHEIKDEADLMFYAKELAREGVTRAQKMILAETLSGGAPGLETTEALSIAFTQLMQLHDRMTDTAQVEIESADGTIIGQLFAGLDSLQNSTDAAISNPVEIPATASDALLIEDNGLKELPPDPSRAPRKNFDKELVRAFAASSSDRTPTTEELPRP